MPTMGACPSIGDISDRLLTHMSRMASLDCIIHYHSVHSLTLSLGGPRILKIVNIHKSHVTIGNTIEQKKRREGKTYHNHRREIEREQTRIHRRNHNQKRHNKTEEKGLYDCNEPNKG